jgi:two-component system, NtrC family, nitrogen regulation sensor histidine kinase NtrY
VTRRRRLAQDRRVLMFALLAGLPGSALALGFLWLGPYDRVLQVTATCVLALAWWGLARAAQNAVVRPLQTVSNLLSALREEDFSFRVRSLKSDDALSDVLAEVNALSDTLRHQRLGALEATALLKKVMDEIDVAVFAFDGERRLRLVNRAGERLLGQNTERLLGESSTDLGLEDALRGETPRILDTAFRESPGRYEVRRSTIRQEGLPQELLVMTNMGRALREEERQAWRRLIRVLGHELNNSLTPIKSIAQSLASLVARTPRPADADADMSRGLEIIADRADALARFTDAYARLARLPPPRLQDVSVRALAAGVVALESRRSIGIEDTADVVLSGDVDQLQQALINLVRNAVDAAIETSGNVRLFWQRRQEDVEIVVEDEGPGLTNPANLFVPFFTTKLGGSGIGLVLSRQIAESHGGSLVIENRRGVRGARARLRLPVGGGV